MSSDAVAGNPSSVSVERARAAGPPSDQVGEVGQRAAGLTAVGASLWFRDPSGNNVRLTQVLEFDPIRS
ncbi:MAG: hypothetical protein JWO12_737 [Frankiales bacterium]|nr:hypothetical protein [Frankiales bacterium]